MLARHGEQLVDRRGDTRVGNTERHLGALLLLGQVRVEERSKIVMNQTYARQRLLSATADDKKRTQLPSETALMLSSAFTPD